MAFKDWKISKRRDRPTTKLEWDSIEGDILAIDHKPDMSIPYRIILNDREIDSTGTLARAKGIASRYRRTHA